MTITKIAIAVVATLLAGAAQGQTRTLYQVSPGGRPAYVAPAPIAQSRERSCRISLTTFEMLQHGMTYADARAIIGCAGKQFAYMENAGNNVTIYFWNGPGCEGCSGAYVTFANDSLEQKSQISLGE